MIPDSPGLGALVVWMPRRRKRQLAALFALMLAGAVAELMAIGAVLPFLRLVVAPERMLAEPYLAGLRQSLDWRTPSDLVVPAALLLIACAVAAAAVRLLLTWAGQRFIYRLGHDMDTALFRRAVHQSYLAHIGRNASEVLAGFDKINALTNMLLLPVMQAATSAVIAVFIVALLFWVHPVTATLTAAGSALIYAGIVVASRPALRRASEDRARLATARIGAVREALGALRDVILDRSQPLHERRFAAMNAAFRNAGAHAAIVAAIPRYVVEGTGVALIGSIAIYLARQPGGVLAAVPVLGVLVLGAQRLLPLLQASYQGIIQYLGMRRSLADVLELMTMPIAPAAPDAAPAPFADRLTFAGVGFRYPDGRAALAGVDLVVARGERIGLIGRTGSGKSTLVDLLMGLLPPTEGEILLDGTPLIGGQVAAWQARIAHVPQSVFLADASIAANIAFAAGEAIAMDRVVEAAQRAQLHDDVGALPAGYDTVVGERGVRLSGGQRQRIGLARAFYRRADVLILDEATSALDDATEAAVVATVAALGRDLTVVAIAHRRSSLDGYDAVYQLDNGRIVGRNDRTAEEGAAL